MTGAAVLPDFESLDRDALKALIVTQHGQLLPQHVQLFSNKGEIERLQLLVAKLRRMQFGRKSEKLDWEIATLELKVEELQAQQGERGREAKSTQPPARSSGLHSSNRPARQHILKSSGRYDRSWPVLVVHVSCKRRAEWANRARCGGTRAFCACAGPEIR
jgi:Transposase C of IS166 homeodomain